MDPATFSGYFTRLAPMLLKKVGKNCTPAEKSFGVGSTAECLESLAGHLDPYVDSLLNMFLNMTKDEDEDVRNNAVYGAGELALHGGKVSDLWKTRKTVNLSFSFTLISSIITPFRLKWSECA
jgi:hypothetical protein